jgi:hypothetical protein
MVDTAQVNAQIGFKLSFIIFIFENRYIFYSIQVTTDPDVDNIIINKPTDAIEDIPVFKNEDDKRQFEANLSIDLPTF